MERLTYVAENGDLQIESKPKSRDYFCGCRARLEILCIG